MSDGGVRRTALATPGLLYSHAFNNEKRYFLIKKKFISDSELLFN